MEIAFRGNAIPHSCFRRYIDLISEVGGSQSHAKSGILSSRGDSDKPSPTAWNRSTVAPNGSPASSRASLQLILETSDRSSHLTPGKDDSQLDTSDNVNTNTSTPRPPRQPFWDYNSSCKEHATSEELYRLMMADVQTSPRPEAEQPAQAPLSSSSQDQKPALAGSPDNKLGTDTITAIIPVVETDAAAENEADAEALLPKLDPAGFFTLISNSTANTTHHPTVKYIFLDDDPDTLTAALAAHHSSNQISTPSASASTSKSGPGKNLNPNRAVLLDVVPGEDDQWKVSSVASLSADFAVTDASISRQEGEKEGGLVLKIEGVESEGATTMLDKEKDRAESLPSSNSGVAKSGGEEYGPLLEDFERKMSVLRRVVKAGEGRAESARETKPSDAEVEPTEE
ncbi:hypothetical protein CORC01_13091 [Colletotrichum orchidophilum]|uniref:Uncharacterized protein n=1 Tax=Colletotrichum orchidophilum TaxID=1209926 RepID=A0A1G4AR14_9PEZI|nr:uncharacterized protein CORC01_13091 [Colletotrichum orchidophilum]OHE91614.1 hypothetical protein CORC01_13091 [Colletotrichum orchidophilum]